MAVSRERIRFLYKQIPNEAHEFITQKMNWKSKNAIQIFFSKQLVSERKFSEIVKCFEEWKDNNCFVPVSVKVPIDLKQAELNAIKGGGYELMQLSTYTYYFLKQTT